MRRAVRATSHPAPPLRSIRGDVWGYMSEEQRLGSPDTPEGRPPRGPVEQPPGSKTEGPKPFWRRVPFLMAAPPLAFIMIVTAVGFVASSSTARPAASALSSAQALASGSPGQSPSAPTRRFPSPPSSVSPSSPPSGSGGSSVPPVGPTVPPVGPTVPPVGPTVPPVGPTGGSAAPWAILPVLLLIGAIIVALVVWRRRSRRTATTPQPASGQSVQAVAHAGPPGPVTIHATGKGATLTVRIERHPSPGVTTIEEVPPR